eukprot:gene19490-19917_t
MLRRMLANGFAITTYDPPPAGFDPLSASPVVQASHGFSIFLRDPSDYERMLAGALVEHALFEPRLRRRRRGRARGRGFLHGPAGVAGLWSGVVSDNPSGDRIVAAGARWTMPAASAPPGEVGACVASLWTGIDGDHPDSDVLQAGCDVTVNVAAATPLSYAPWYEWYPGRSEFIANLPVSQGDELNCLVKLDPADPAKAVVVVSNMTTRQSPTPITVEAPPGRQLLGNCLEWIVETNATLGPLANFGAVTFRDCFGKTAAGATFGAAGGRPLSIRDPVTDLTISSGSIQGQDVEISSRPSLGSLVFRACFPVTGRVSCQRFNSAAFQSKAARTHATSAIVSGARAMVYPVNAL